jgi:acyl carrier protein
VTSPGALIEAMRALVTRVAGPSRAPVESGPATPLSEGGFWLDSVELLEVVVACESEFDITFDATRDFAGDAFETLGTLAALVDRKRAAVRAGP